MCCILHRAFLRDFYILGFFYNSNKIKNKITDAIYFSQTVFFYNLCLNN